MKSWSTAIVNDPEDGWTIACESCEQAVCSICGHEPCPCCIDFCDCSECIDWDESGKGKDGHQCVFTACPEHVPEGILRKEKDPSLPAA